MSRNDVADWVTLTEGEEVLWQGHPSLRLITPSVVVGLVLALGGVVLTVVLTEPTVRWLPLLGVPLGIAVVAWAYVSLVSTRYALTSEEVYRKSGILNQSVAQIRLDRVQNTTFSQSPTERLFSYGDITIYTAGSDTMDITLENVPNPQEVNQRLTEALDAASGSGARVGP
ncbi:PH domain-containing protein [Halococcus sediminicola]|uniref:PH domain-containing protein n=1 Tax=Halococcus sediminicola TaxID=1264579 RepID=UPI000678AF0D|nr:PH domain-containing protein [Halococcus sediminicola]